MSTSLFAIPLKQGKHEAYKAFMRECVGSKKQEYADLLTRYGLKNVKSWTHHFSGMDYVLFVHDVEEDAFERLKGWTSSTHPFDQWFNEQLLNCYDEVYYHLLNQFHKLFLFTRYPEVECTNNAAERTLRHIVL